MSRFRIIPLLAVSAIALSGCTGAAFGAPATSSAATITADAISATEGSLVGGESIQITGSGLDLATAITVDGMDATILGATDDSLDFTMPHSQEYVSGETVPVEVLSGAEVVAAFDYTYFSLTPVDRQMQYAFAYWDNYNVEFFGDFNGWGGDCINFVSQTLLARGWSVTDEWFNDAQVDWAQAFVHVPSFDEWLSSHPEYGAVRLGMDRVADVKIGDVVLFDWEGDGSLDHAQVVSGVEGAAGAPEILMVGHNVDSDYRSIAAALAEQGKEGAQVFFWSIP